MLNEHSQIKKLHQDLLEQQIKPQINTSFGSDYSEEENIIDEDEIPKFIHKKNDSQSTRSIDSEVQDMEESNEEDDNFDSLRQRQDTFKLMESLVNVV